MIFTTAKELNLRGLNINSLEIELNNRIFTRGPDFSKKMRHVALSFCEKYPQGSCLIVEDKHYFTVWIEKSIQESIDRKKNKTKSIEVNNIPLDDDFKKVCQEELTQLIGPIAGIVCAKAHQANLSISKTNFVKTLAAKIPDSEKAQLFEEKLLKLIN